MKKSLDRSEHKLQGEYGVPLAQDISCKPLGKQRCGARLDCEPNAAAFQHSLTVGETVAVFSLADSGPIIEGTGIIESVGPAPYRYYVRFIGEPLARLRFVNPDWQACPARSLALLREFWLSTCASNPCIEDFFPDISATAEE